MFIAAPGISETPRPIGHGAISRPSREYKEPAHHHILRIPVVSISFYQYDVAYLRVVQNRLTFVIGDFIGGLVIIPSCRLDHKSANHDMIWRITGFQCSIDTPMAFLTGCLRYRVGSLKNI